MARRKKISKILSEKEKELQLLTDRKVELLKGLVLIEKSFNSLSNQDIKSPEDWLYGLPIESLKQLNIVGKRRTRLGDVRIRAGLKKSSVEAIKELEQLDRKIRDVTLDLVAEKINITLKESESVK